MFIPIVDEATLEKVQVLPYDPFLVTNPQATSTLTLSTSNPVLLRLKFPDTKTPSIGRSILVLSPVATVSESTSNVVTFPYVIYGITPVVTMDATSYLTGVMNVNERISTYVGDFDPAEWALIRSSLSAATGGSVKVSLSPDNNYVTELVAGDLSTSSDLSAFIGKTVEIYSSISAETDLEDTSVVIRKLSGVTYDAAVNMTYTQLSSYIVDDLIVSAPLSRFKDKVYLEITNFLEEDETEYVLMLTRNSASVFVDATTTRGNSETTMVFNSIHVQPMANPRDISKTLGGPYYGYVLDTYASPAGRMPVPWFDVAEAKRIAQRINQTNYFSSSDRLEITYDYNDDSQTFSINLTDFNNSGIRVEISRIAPSRIGSRLLYPMLSYEIPWLLTNRPEPTLKDRTTTFDLDVDQLFGGSNVTASGESA